jgi:hypothetical protein
MATKQINASELMSGDVLMVNNNPHKIVNIGHLSDSLVIAQDNNSVWFEYTKTDIVTVLTGLETRLERGSGCAEYIFVIALIAFIVWLIGSWAFGTNNPLLWYGIFETALKSYTPGLEEIINRFLWFIGL